MQRLEGLGHGVVVDVSHAVQEEDVGAQFGSGGPGFDAGQVDVADAELGHRRHQRPGGVVDAQHHRGAVGTGPGRRRPRRPDEDEPGPRVGFVDDTVGQRRQPVALRGQRGAHTGVGTTGGHVLGRGRVGVGRHDLGRRQVLGQPCAHLGGRNGERRDRAHRIGAPIGPGDDAERHVEGEFPVDLQRCAGGQAVQRRQHGAVDGVLDRHAGEVRGAGADGGQCGRGAVHRLRCDVAPAGDHPRGGHLQQRRFGEGPLGSEVGDAGHGPTLSGHAARKPCVAHESKLI